MRKTPEQVQQAQEAAREQLRAIHHTEVAAEVDRLRGWWTAEDLATVDPNNTCPKCNASADVRWWSTEEQTVTTPECVQPYIANTRWSSHHVPYAPHREELALLKDSATAELCEHVPDFVTRGLICRTCSRCAFVWVELPLDKDPVGEGFKPLTSQLQLIDEPSGGGLGDLAWQLDHPVTAAKPT